VGDVLVTADLRAGTVTCQVDLNAPREGRPTTRVNWLLRQLKAAPGGVRIEAHAAHERGPGAAELLKTVRENSALLIADPTKELRSFRVAMTVPMGTNRKGGRGSFIDSVTAAIDTFYSEVVQHLKAWAAAPPRLRSDAEVVAPDDAEVAPALVSTALSSQDDPTPAGDGDNPAPADVVGVAAPPE